MKVKNFSDNNLTLFENVTVGNCFVYNGIPYIRTKDHNLTGAMREFNAVNLLDGTLFNFDRDIDFVAAKPNAEITLNN